MVSRIMFWMSVWPIVSDSITKPRDRNRLMTRLNVNGLLSIVATSVCFKGNHLRERCPGNDHREHIFIRVNQELDQGWARCVHRPANGLGNLGRILDLAGRDAIEIGRASCRERV